MPGRSEYRRDQPITADKSITLVGGLSPTGTIVPLAVSTSGASGVAKSSADSYVAGDLGNLIMGTRNDGNATLLGQANGRYTPLSLTNRGAAHAILSYESGTTFSPHRVEDEALANGHGLMVMGLQAVNELSQSVSGTNDAAFAKSDLKGALLINDTAPVEQRFQATSAAATDTSDTAILAAGAAGVRHYVTDLIIYNSSAVASVITIKSGSTTLAELYAKANETMPPISLKAPLRGGAAEALQFQMATTGTNTKVTAIGYSLVG